jgi:hypothetical protein
MPAAGDLARPIMRRAAGLQRHAETITRHPVPWNRGRLVGQKPPLKRKDIWAIRITLKVAQRPRDLALLNLALDSKLRGCDLV